MKDNTPHNFPFIRNKVLKSIARSKSLMQLVTSLHTGNGINVSSARNIHHRKCLLASRV